MNTVEFLFQDLIQFNKYITFIFDGVLLNFSQNVYSFYNRIFKIMLGAVQKLRYVTPILVIFAPFPLCNET